MTGQRGSMLNGWDGSFTCISSLHIARATIKGGKFLYAAVKPSFGLSLRSFS
jgi:hypothetical protein